MGSLGSKGRARQGDGIHPWFYQLGQSQGVDKTEVTEGLARVPRRLFARADRAGLLHRALGDSVAMATRGGPTGTWGTM